MPFGCALFTRCWQISRPFRQPNDSVLTIYIHHFSVFQIWCFYSVKTNTCHNESCLIPTWGWWKSFPNAMCCCMSCAFTRDHHRCCRIASWTKKTFSLQTCPSGIPRGFSDQKSRKWTMEPPKLAVLYRCVSFSKAIFPPNLVEFGRWTSFFQRGDFQVPFAVPFRGVRLRLENPPTHSQVQKEVEVLQGFLAVSWLPEKLEGFSTRKGFWEGHLFQENPDRKGRWWWIFEDPLIENRLLEWNASQQVEED